jgi:hypothetical protein
MNDTLFQIQSPLLGFRILLTCFWYTAYVLCPISALDKWHISSFYKCTQSVEIKSYDTVNLFNKKKQINIYK